MYNNKFNDEAIQGLPFECWLKNNISNNRLPPPLITQGWVHARGIELRNLAPKKLTKYTIILTYNFVQDVPGGRRTKRRGFGWRCQDVPDDWQELPCPWTGEGSSVYGPNSRQYPLVWQDIRRESVVAT